MNQVEVQIMGQSYLLGCPPGAEERFQAAVRRVDAAMCSIRDAGKIKARDRIAVLASGGGSNLQALLDHLDALGDAAPGRVTLVISDRADAVALDRARRRGIAAVVEDALHLAGHGTAGLHVSLDMDACDPQVLELVVLADSREADAVVDLAVLVQCAGGILGDDGDTAVVFEGDEAAPARDALARVVRAVLHDLFG